MSTSKSGRLIVCRGCCCGVVAGRNYGAKRRLSELLALNELGFAVKVSDCLGPCNEGDMIVFLPGANSHLKSKGPMWFKEMHIESLHSLFIDWIKSEESCFSGFFELLEPQLFQPNKANRKVIDEQLSCAL